MLDSVIGYMDLIDYEEALPGGDINGNLIFPTIESLQKRFPCTERCGIVKVEVKLVEIVKPYKRRVK